MVACFAVGAFAVAALAVGAFATGFFAVGAATADLTVVRLTGAVEGPAPDAVGDGAGEPIASNSEAGADASERGPPAHAVAAATNTTKHRSCTNRRRGDHLIGNGNHSPGEDASTIADGRSALKCGDPDCDEKGDSAVGSVHLRAMRNSMHTRAEGSRWGQECSGSHAGAGKGIVTNGPGPCVQRQSAPRRARLSCWHDASPPWLTTVSATGQVQAEGSAIHVVEGGSPGARPSCSCTAGPSARRPSGRSCCS